MKKTTHLALIGVVLSTVIAQGKTANGSTQALAQLNPNEKAVLIELMEKGFIKENPENNNMVLNVSVFKILGHYNLINNLNAENSENLDFNSCTGNCEIIDPNLAK